MKKHFYLSLLMLSVAFGSVSAQKFVGIYFPLPVYQTPKQQTYAHYKTYSCYAFYANAPADYKIDGYYKAVNEYVLKEDTVNADIKIVLEFTSISNPKVILKKDTAFVTASEMKFAVVAYDKNGKQVCNNYVSYANPSAYVLKKATEKNSALFYNPLMQKMVEIAAKMVVAKELINDNFFTSQTISGNAPQIGYLQKGFFEDTLTVYKTKALKEAQTPAELLDIARSQLDFWQSLANYPVDKKTDGIRLCGYYNLALLNYLLGNTAESDKNLAEMNAVGQNGFTKDAVKKFTNFKENYKPDFWAAPKFKSDDTKSTVSTEQLVERITYFVINDAKITLSDGTVYTGKCKVTRRSKNGSQEGNIANFDKADFVVKIDTPDGIKTTMLSKVKTIDSTDEICIVKNRELFVSVFEGKKISVYERVVADGSYGFLYYKKANEDKLESAPLLGKGKWYKKYFSECPAVAAKVDKDELSGTIEIAKFYENCQ